MKDYIYLDQQRLNSTLAQLNGGIIETYQKIHGEAETDQQSASGGAKINVGLKALLNAQASFSSENSASNTSTSTEMLNFAMNDYAIDTLLNQLSEETFFKRDIFSASEGDVIHIKSKVKIYNFSNTSKMLKPENTELMLNTVDDIAENEKNRIKIQQLNDKKKGQSKKANQPIDKKIQKYKKLVNDYEANVRDSQATFTQIQRATEFINTVVNGSIVITGDGSLIIANRNDFRYSDAQLSFLANSNREAMILGTVISIQEEIHADGEFNQLRNNDLDVVPRMFADVFLSNFEMLKKGDKIISPIAIYFE